MDLLTRRPDAVLLVRDPMLVPGRSEADPDAGRTVAGVDAAIAALRDAGVRVGALSAGGTTVHERDVRHGSGEIDHRAVPFTPWLRASDSTRVGLVREGIAELGVRPERTTVVGTSGADVRAAHTAGANAVLVPGQSTDMDAILTAPAVAPDLARAVEHILGCRVGAAG